MKHVIKIETGIRVLTDDACKPDEQAEPGQSLDEIVKDIDERANFISPVLDNLLHLQQDIPRWSLRE